MTQPVARPTGSRPALRVSWGRKYLPLLVGVPVCLGAGWFELTRALHGREVAWVYAFEWPLYALIGSYLWWRIWHSPSAGQRRSRTSTAATPYDSSRQPGALAAAPFDPGLDAWERYVAQLQHDDPPGGPPSSS